MASSVPLQVAETVQTAHINRAPSASHDINPSTAASLKEPVILEEKRPLDDADSVNGDDTLDDVEDEIPYSVIRPKRRSSHMPPLPDLRFEQSYLHSIAGATTWGKIAWITIRDQVVMPFAQGVIYNIVLLGWQFWNKNAQIQGSSLGARIRRWWYGVNNWPIPKEKTR